MDISGLVSILIYLVIAGLIFWVLWWALAQIGIPEPFNKVIRVILVLVVVLFLVNLLLGFMGTPVFRLR